MTNALGGAPNLETAPGNFVLWLEWDTGADVDLYVCEPGGCKAAWQGTTTSNGFFSAESVSAGESHEYYAAAETVEKGEYWVYANYYADNGATAPAQVTLKYYDPTVPGYDQQLATVATVTMSLQNPAPDAAGIESNNYSDWWKFGKVVRTEAAGTVPTPRTFEIGGTRIHFQAMPDKGKQAQMPIPDASANDVVLGMAGAK